MTLQQLRYVMEIAKHGNHLSAAANALNTSQPGVSRQVQMLEHELGFEIFQRTRNRIIGLTEPGQLVLAIAQRVSTDVAALATLKADMHAGNRGSFTIATTYTQARHVLPPVVEKFMKQYPDVKLTLRQGLPDEVCSLVENGDVDLALTTETVEDFPNLVKFDCFEMTRSIVARAGHPILAAPELTLAEIAKYPLIAMDSRYSGRWKVMKAFADAGLEPNVVLSAIDADVCKTYVELGLGIAIMATATYNRDRDIGMEARDASHVLPASTTSLLLRPNTYLRPFLLAFIRAIEPNLTPVTVRRRLEDFQPARG